MVLHFIVREGQRCGDPDAAASRARVTACERLIAHYSDHPDMDACLSCFRGGVWIPQAEMLMRDMAEHSSHSHVRAAAWYYLARWLKQKSELPRIREKLRAHLEFAPEHQKAWQIRRLESYGLFGDIHSEQVRQEAIAAARYMQQHFPDERHPARSFSGPAYILLTRDDTCPQQDVFSEKAENLIFEIEHLSIGSTAPEITGTDADGVNFHLSDYRGRVVVLMFSANWCGPCKGMYPDNRKLVDTLADDAIDTVQQAHEDGEITWRVWWDGACGPIQTRWNINSWPSIFVIDHRGAIRDKDLRGEKLDSAVVKLLQERAADPDADALLEAHPIPDIPTHERARGAEGD